MHPKTSIRRCWPTLGMPHHPIFCLSKTLRIVGDRVWTKSAGAITPTSPRSFERMPLIYGRAFEG